MAKKYYRIIKQENEAKAFLATTERIKERFTDIQKKAATASADQLEAIHKLIENNRGIANSSSRFALAHEDSNLLSKDTIEALGAVVKEFDTLLSTLDFTKTQADALADLESWLNGTDKED